MTKRILFILLALVLAVSISLIGCGGGQQEEEEEEALRITMGSTEAVSSFYPMCSQIVNLINQDCEGVVEVTLVETSASYDNTGRMQLGQIDTSLVVGHEPTQELYAGTGHYEGDPPREDLRNWHVQVCPQDLIVVWENSPIYDIEDLEGEHFHIGHVGSGSLEHMTKIMEILDIEVDHYPGSMADAVTAMKDRMIVGMYKTAPLRGLDSTMLDLQSIDPIRIFCLTTEQKDKVVAGGGFPTWQHMEMGPWAGFDEPQGDFWTTFRPMTSLLTSDIPQEVGYLMTKAIFEHPDEMLATMSMFVTDPERQLKLHISLAGNPPMAPMHAGVIQYWKELGLDVPAELIPPEYTE